MTRRPQRFLRSRRGLSMVEMMVAVALLGIGISACVACIGSASRASGAAEAYTAVQLMAREKLAEIELAGGGEGPSEGDFGADRPGYWWRVQSEEAGLTGTQPVKLTVFWGDPERPHQAEFVTEVRRRSSGMAASPSPCASCHRNGIPGAGGGDDGGPR
jgi:prepilin-type N-terminal cleavage/methylation domain-containing protein